MLTDERVPPHAPVRRSASAKARRLAARVGLALPSSADVLTVAQRSRAWVSAHRFDLTVISTYVFTALVLTSQLWARPREVTVPNRQDQIFFEFVLARAARAVTHFENPMFTHAMNTPHGVNLMANTSVLGLSIPLAPITLAWGPSISFVLLTIFAFIATATAWYLVLQRFLVRSRLAAAIGAAFCAYGPAMISQGDSHPNLVAQFLVPVIIWRVAILGRSTRLARDGVILGLLVAYQIFINEEVLLLTAMALVVCTVVDLASAQSTVRAAWRGYLKGLAIAALVALDLLIFPLFFQFFGPQSYSGIPPGMAARLGLNAASYVSYPPQSLWGAPLHASALAPNPTERNSFFGWPLVLLLIGIAIWQWRRPAVRMTSVTLAFFTALSFGVDVKWNSHVLPIPGPWRLLVNVPLFDSVVPARFGLGASAAAGVLLALGIDAVSRVRTDDVGLVIRLTAVATVATALIPLIPHWTNARVEPATPEFVTSGTWQEYLGGGRRAMLVADTTHEGDLYGMRWSNATGQDMAVARGYFLGPNPFRADRAGTYNSPYNSTTFLLYQVATSGKVPKITPSQRTRARMDLAKMSVGLVVIPPSSFRETQLHATLEDLLGQRGMLVQGMWIWPIT